MVFEKVKSVIIEQLGIDEAEVKMEANFADDLGVDSLEIFEIIMALEDAFEIAIPTEDIENIKEVNQIVKNIAEKVDYTNLEAI
jgi:acyl carrier protein